MIEPLNHLQSGAWFGEAAATGPSPVNPLLQSRIGQFPEPI